MRLKGTTILLIVTFAAGCGGDSATPVAPRVPTTTTMPPPPLTAPALLAPKEGEMIHQSDPTLGCPFDGVYGTGFAIPFEWSPQSIRPGGVQYDLFAQRKGANLPLVNTTVDTPEFRYLACNSYVANPNLRGWSWRVRARTATETGPWSEERSFQFAPCYIQNHPCGSTD